jgi:protocatechuate 3,4-dioxygenase beta subunit
MAIVAALSLVAALAAQTAQADAFAHVSGRVITAGTATPLAGAQVILVPIRRGPTMPDIAGPPARRTTDEAGRFTFERLAAGEYNVRVSKPGFFEQLPGLYSGEPPTPPLQIAAGQTLDLADLTLARGGTISGRVVDESGAPITGAQVVAMRRAPSRGADAAGSPFMPLGASEHTNDRGEFRLSGVAPGEYAVAAAPVRPPGSGTSATSVPTTTFAPGTTDPFAAAMVAVTPGDAVNGVEVQLVTAPAFNVSGWVVDERGVPVAGATVHLTSADRSRIIGGPIGGVSTDHDGRFTIGGIVSGTYHAFAAVRLMPWIAAPPAIDVVVNGTDVTGMRIVIQAR